MRIKTIQNLLINSNVFNNAVLTSLFNDSDFVARLRENTKNLKQRRAVYSVAASTVVSYVTDTSISTSGSPKRRSVLGAVS